MPNSGKTTTATQLGKYISTLGHSVLLVFCDANLPPKEYLMADNEDVSLGSILSAPELSEKMILKATTPINEHLGVIGYKKGEMVSDYPHVTEIAVTRFLEKISNMADYILFDVQNTNDVFSKKIEEVTSATLTVINPNIKSIAYINKKNISNLSKGISLISARDIVVINDYKKGDITEIDMRQKNITLPHDKDLKNAFETMELFKPTKNKNYTKEIKKLFGLL